MTSIQTSIFSSKLHQSILVTGGSRGIGRAIAISLVRDKIPIFVNYNTDYDSAKKTCNLIKGLGGHAFPIAANIADSNAVSKMFDKIHKQGFWVHTLVNNAGITKDNLFALMSKENWNNVLNVNLSGSFYCISRALKMMIVNRSGQIVNVSSVSGIRGAVGQANYSASKAGIIALTRSLAREVGPYGIRVNAVAPGFIETDMLVQLRSTVSGKKILKDMKNKLIPLCRFGLPEEVAESVRFVCSEAAGYITGHVLVIDGGLSI